MNFTRLPQFLSLLAALFLGFSAVPTAFAAPENPLAEYVRRPDETFSFTKESVRPIGRDAQAHILRLTSQKWQGIEWQHRLTIAIPSEIRHSDSAILIVSGGSNQSERSFDRLEFQLAARIAETLGVAVAILEQVPNQPLMGGLNEDELIAHTFSQRLQTGDPDWPLLFPMVKSATLAMDAVTAYLAEQNGNGPSKFILTGASKRGWTAWLAAAVDERVSAIAPMVFDILNFRPQLAQQREYFHGGYSPEIRAYEERDLFSLLESPAGAALADTMDPFSYRDRLTMPKLILLGTNDPYWTVDASSLYLHDLPGENHLYYAPNTGHGLGENAVPTLLAFLHATLSGRTLPELQWQRQGNQLQVKHDRPATEARLWTATSPTRNFREATWTSETIPHDKNKTTAPLATPSSAYTAQFVEIIFPSKTAPFALSTEILLTPPKSPKP